MKIAVLGTGMVGRALAGRLAELGHDVAVGTRDVADTRRAADYAAWQTEHPAVSLLRFREAGEFGHVVLNAVAGVHALAALDEVGPDALAGKVLLDLAIPLDLSNGMPPQLTTSNTDSLGEQIQAAFPNARVVKSLHTVYYEVMIDPHRVPGDHSLFVAGNDSAAKNTVTGILEQFNHIDEGDRP